jgi:putative transposase
MSDHFHVLVEVPPRPKVLPGPEEVVQELQRLSGHQFVDAVSQRFAAYHERGDTKGLAADLAMFHARMYDLSAFMKLVKQRFTQGFNARHRRKGTLWEQRFKSVLVEGAGEAPAIMAAYIDLNPVRAGIVNDPKDYRWSGYGEAMAGRKQAKAGLQAVVTARHQGRDEGPTRWLEIYRQYLYPEKDAPRKPARSDRKPSAKTAAEVLQAKGKVTLPEYLRCRVRYFSDGAALGDREWVEGIFGSLRKRFGAKRKTGARPMRGLLDRDLYTLRDLQRRVFGPPPPQTEMPEKGT